MNRRTIPSLVILACLILMACPAWSAEGRYIAKDEEVAAKLRTWSPCPRCGQDRQMEARASLTRSFTSSGKEHKLTVSAVMRKTREWIYDYAWGDYAYRTTAADYEVTLFLDAKPVYRSQTRGDENITFDVQLPTMDLVEVTVDASRSASRFVFTIERLQVIPGEE